MERVQLWFQPGDRREGFHWSTTYQGRLVGLCNQPLCDICNLSEREKLKGFRGGKLEIQLSPPYRRPSFWETKEFYLGHLIRIMPSETVEWADEGIEFDISKLNTIICSTPQGSLLIDPGTMGFDNEKFSLQQLIGRKKIVFTIVTHGHLDHWNKLGESRSNIFMPKVAFQLASRHAYWQRDNQMVGALRRARMIVPGEPILLNDFPLKVETFPLPHSIPGTMGLVIKGQRGRFVYWGDSKFNGMETRSKIETINLLSQIAREPVDVLSLNAINAHIGGFTPLESLVIDALTNIMIEAKGRVIIACFSTNQDRIKRLAEFANLLGRPVAFLGAGMQNAQEFLEIETEGGSVESDKAVVFITGCQAEEKSGLLRAAKDLNSSLNLEPADTVVLSSRCIPGNELGIREMVNAISSRVARVIVNEGEKVQVGLEDPKVAESFIHVSGHGSREDIRLVLEILRPKKVLVWPQNSPQIEAFRAIADPLGIEILPENQRVIEI